MKENLRFKINRASLIVGSKFTVFALFFQIQARGGLVFERGDLTEGFLRFNGLGGYIWRGLDMERLIFGILRYVYICLENIFNNPLSPKLSD